MSLTCRGPLPLKGTCKSKCPPNPCPVNEDLMHTLKNICCHQPDSHPGTPFHRQGITQVRASFRVTFEFYMIQLYLQLGNLGRLGQEEGRDEPNEFIVG